MKRLVWQPELWLIAIALLVAALLRLTGRLEPVMSPDSQSYLRFHADTLATALSQVRTLGYPLFLKCVGTVDAVPWAHCVVFFLAVGLFYRGLVGAGYRRWTAMWCAAAMLFGRAVVDFGMLVLADSLALSLAIASAGSFLAVTSPKAKWPSWTALAALTFLTYQVRPAYLFLIPLWPLTSFFLDRFLLRADKSLAALFRRTGWVFAASSGPFFAFLVFRWLVVGHWGLVSFAGYNFVGISGQFLDEELAGQLSKEVRPFAKELLRRREALEDAAPPSDFHAMELMYNPVIWKVAVPVAEELTDSDPVAVNDLLSRFSREVIMRRPKKYLQWLLWNANHARQQLLTLTIFDKGTVFLCLAYLATQAVSLTTGRDDEPRRRRQTEGQASPRRIELHLLFWTALLFAMAKAMLVILVEPAHGRYMAGAMALAPAAIAVWVAHAAERVAGGFAARFEKE